MIVVGVNFNGIFACIVGCGNFIITNNVTAIARELNVKRIDIIAICKYALVSKGEFNCFVAVNLSFSINAYNYYAFTNRISAFYKNNFIVLIGTSTGDRIVAFGRS